MVGTLLNEDIEIDPTTGEPWVAHIVKKGDQMEGYVNGKAIEALCGKKLVPSRNPHNKPVCEECKEVFRRVGNSPIN